MSEVLEKKDVNFISQHFAQHSRSWHSE